ncbi:MAG: hypothetical protein HY205_00895, partial [Nitrospirae bacterium]|nr:hypothetical protein [Nitrospirota bacterium]
MPTLLRRQLYRWLPHLISMSALLALLIGLVSLQHVKQQRVTSAGEGLALAATDIADTLDRSLFARYGDVQMMADAFARQMHDPPAITWYLDRMKDRYLVYRWLGVTDPNGRVVAATDPGSVGEDWSGRTWFQAARDTWGVHVEGVQGSHEPDRHRGVTFASPIWDDQGRFRGVVATHMDIAEVEEVFVQAADMIKGVEGPAATIEWQLLASDGTVIAGSTAQDDGA